MRYINNKVILCYVESSSVLINHHKLHIKGPTLSLSTLSYCLCGLPSSVLDVGEGGDAYRSRRSEAFFVMCLLACVAVAGFRFLASSQTGARKARNLYSAPAYTSKAREKRPGDQVAAYAKNGTWVCESPSLRSFFLGREGRILSISPNRRSRDSNFLRFTHGPPRVSLGPVVFVLSFSQAEGLAANSSWRLSGP